MKSNVAPSNLEVRTLPIHESYGGMTLHLSSDIVLRAMTEMGRILKTHGDNAAYSAYLGLVFEADKSIRENLKANKNATVPPSPAA